MIQEHNNIPHESVQVEGAHQSPHSPPGGQAFFVVAGAMVVAGADVEGDCGGLCCGGCAVVLDGHWLSHSICQGSGSGSSKGWNQIYNCCTEFATVWDKLNSILSFYHNYKTWDTLKLSMDRLKSKKLFVNILKFLLTKGPQTLHPLLYIKSYPFWHGSRGGWQGLKPHGSVCEVSPLKYLSLDTEGFLGRKCFLTCKDTRFLWYTFWFWSYSLLHHSDLYTAKAVSTGPIFPRLCKV